MGLYLSTAELRAGVGLEDVEEAEAKPVFYAVIMGRLAYRHQVSMWLGSLRKTGGWKGEAVIVTDKAVCLTKTLSEVGLLGKQIHDDQDVTIYAPAEGSSGNLHIVKRPSVNSVLKMKLEKARAFLNLKVAQIPYKVSSVVYTDEDIVFGYPVASFMQEVRTLEPLKHTLALFRDTGYTRGQLHTGIVVMFPTERTDKCLQAWGQKLTSVKIGSAQETLVGPISKAYGTISVSKLKAEDSEMDMADNSEGDADSEESDMEVTGPDQIALKATKPCRLGPDSDGIKILPKKYFMLPTAGRINSGSTTTFVHFTNTGRWAQINAGDLKKYLARIGAPMNINPKGSVQDKTCAAELDQ